MVVGGGNFEDDSFLLKKDTLDINRKQFTHMHYSNSTATVSSPSSQLLHVHFMLGYLEKQTKHSVALRHCENKDGE